MLLQNSPFRDFDSLFDQLSSRSGTSRPAPMDAYRRGDDIWVHIDLPGVAADSIDISVERNVLTITGERTAQREEGDRVYFNERHLGTFRRQVTLGDGLDADSVEADFHDGVLSLRIPVAAQAKPRKIEVNSGQKAIDVNASDADTDATV
jgi:HSP20 family protein